MKVQALGRTGTQASLNTVLEEVCQQLNLISSGRVIATNNADTGAPTTGTHNQGDFVKNSTPSGATPTIGWICTASGTPGTWVAVAGGGGSGAPVDATFVTLSTNGTLTNERVLTAGTGITITDNGAGNTVVIDAAGGAPTNATYVCMSTDATLANERVLTAGVGISITDGGAGGAVTIDSTSSNVSIGFIYCASANYLLP